MSAKPEVVVDGLQLTEAPRWFDDRLWFANVTGGQVLVASPADDHKYEVVCDSIPFPCGLGFLPDGTPLVVEVRGRKVWRLGPDGPELHADLSEYTAGMGNDMIVTPAGFAYAGAIQHDFFGTPTGARPTGRPRSEPADKLILITPDGRTRIVADGLSMPNGMALSEDGRLLILAEPGARRILAFDVEPDGSLTGRRVFADTAPSTPDGICLDAEGAVWYGSVAESEFRRVEEGGEVLDRIPIPGRFTIACALGGEDRRTLYMTTAEPIDGERFRTGQVTAKVEAVRVDVPGVGLP